MKRGSRTVEEAAKPRAIEAAAKPTPVDVLIRVGHAAIKAGTSSDVASRGASYARRGNVRALEITGAVVRGTVDGSEREPYRTTVRVGVDGQVDALCTLSV
jgi:uncharacterized Zn finger protein